MFSIFTPPTHTRNHSHRSLFFKFLALLCLLSCSSISTHAEEITYIFTDKSWGATVNGTTANWSSGKDGTSFLNLGIQVTKTTTGANGTSPISFKNISKIVLTYNTNKSSGKGTAEVKIGDNTATSQPWQYSTGDGTSAKYTLTYEYETPQSGNVKITLKTTTNSIYLVSCTITYNPAPVKSDLTTFAFSNATSDIYLTENDGLYEYSGTPQTVSVEPDTYDGEVSYSIDYENSTLTSDEAEIKIDSKTGEITIKCASNLDSNKTLLIKASATATENFNAPADVSYTLTVHPASTKTPVNMTAFSATNTTLIVGETTTTTVANDQEKWTAAYTYQSSNSDVASVNESGEITAVSKGTATITATLNVSSEDENYRIGDTTSKSVEITVNNPSHTAQFSINGTIDSNNDCTTEEGASITFPADPDDINGKKFVGWTTSSINGTQSTAPDVLLSEGTMPTEDKTYYAVFATLIPGNEEEVVDELNHDLIGVKETNYNTWDNLKAPSGAIYAGNSAGSYSSIQLRSKENSGIVTTKSGGKIQKVVVTWNSNTSSGRTLDIYGSNTAYTATADLYSQKTQGIEIGNITYGTSTELKVNDDYKYIGLRSSSNAMYITSIAITWLVEAPDTYSGYCTTVPMGEKDPVSGKYYATYSNTQKFEVPDDVTVAQVVEENGLIYLKRYAPRDVVEANTGVLLESDNKITTAFELTNKEATNLRVINVLKASGAGITADEMGKADNPDDNYFYRLTKGTLNGEPVFGFYWKKTDGSAFDFGANKAYMVLPKKPNGQNAPRYVWLDGQTTAIDGLNADTEATVGSDERIYSLDGRRVEGQLKRGIYVKNGKKFIVR